MCASQALSNSLTAMPRASPLPSGPIASEEFEKRTIARQVAQKQKTDSTYAARSAGIMEFRKVTYASRADGMSVPAYLFAPLAKRGARGHAALVWVHGGVHGDWGTAMLPFVRA